MTLFGGACAFPMPQILSSTPTSDVSCQPCGCGGGEPPCPTSLPPDELATCQSALTQAFSVASTIVAQTATSIALSATPTPTASVTPTRTPVPTSTVWRVQPVATSVTTTYEYLDIYGVDDLPSFDLGSRWKTHSFDENGDNKPDRFLYTVLKVEQEQRWRQSLLEFLMKRGDISQIEHNAFVVLDALDIDLDRDGKRETAFAYHLGQNPPFAFGIAVMRGEQILDSTPLDWKWGYVQEMRLIGVPISSRQNAILSHLTTVTGGSGIYPYIYRRLLTLEEDKLRIAWDWQYFGGARAGASYFQFANEKVEFKRLTNQPYVDILLSREAEGFDLPDNPANSRYYNVQFPGRLVFSWDEEKYNLSHYYDGKFLTPIRASDFVLHAPRIDTSFCDKNRTSGCIIRQIEYRDALDGYGVGISRRSLEVTPYGLAWDEKSLYINLSVFPPTPNKKHSTVWIGLDTDLQGDFDSHALNEDDRLLKIEIEDAAHCDKDLSVQMVYPGVLSLPFENYTQLESCNLELAIPLDTLGLAIPETAQPAKILRFKNNMFYLGDSNLFLHQYFPQPTKVIGFAMFSENTEEEIATALERQSWLHLLPFDPQDPTTWGTLIFISDR